MPRYAAAVGNWWQHIQYVLPVFPRSPGAARVYPLSCLILRSSVLFVCDTHMLVDPTPEQVAEMPLLAAEAVRKCGVAPKAALLSHSRFGASDSDSARKMRATLKLIRSRAPKLEIDGEMHADAALSEAIRNRAVPDSRLEGTANLLVMRPSMRRTSPSRPSRPPRMVFRSGRFCSGYRSPSMCWFRASRRGASSIFRALAVLEAQTLADRPRDPAEAAALTLTS